jgi:hypothetical protein
MKPKTAKPAKEATPVPFRQLLARVMKHEAAGSLMKTAVQTGWLSDENFLMRLDEEEQEQVRTIYNEHHEFRRAPLSDFKASLPEEVGPLCDDYHVGKEKTRLGSSDRPVYVDSRLFLTMKKRYPDSCVYLSSSDNPTSVVFSGRQNAVAVLPIL